MDYSESWLFFSRMFSAVVCQWLVVPLFSFPSIQSYAKGLLQYYDSIITILGEYADFQKHTPLYYLLAFKEKVHVGPWIENTSTSSASCLEASIITNSELLWHFNRMFSFHLSSSLSLSLSLFLCPSFSFSHFHEQLNSILSSITSLTLWLRMT